MTYSSLTLPPLKQNSTEHTYGAKPNSFHMDQYPNMVIVPVIYIMPMWTDIIIPFIKINLSTESIFPSKCEVLRFLNQIDVAIL